MKPSVGALTRRVAQLRRPAPRPEAEPHPDLIQLTPEDRRYLTSLYDDSVALPPSALEQLSRSSPRLRDLRTRYARLALPAVAASRWSTEAVESFLDLRYFRGETLITWHYRELPRITALKYFVLVRYIQERDPQGLLSRLREDGAFGCWTFEYPGYGRFSRDLLESVNEIAFLQREGVVSSHDDLRVLDIGAGYGRLAHRMVEACAQVSDYCCVDAVAESTFLTDYYLEYRGCKPRARVVPLDRVDTELAAGAFDLAINIHSFSECTYAAVEWWLALISRLKIPQLLVIPNEPIDLLSLEPDGSRRDLAPSLERAGYHLVHREPVVMDPAVRELVALHDHFHLYRLESDR